LADCSTTDEDVQNINLDSIKLTFLNNHNNHISVDEAGILTITSLIFPLSIVLLIYVVKYINMLNKIVSRYQYVKSFGMILIVLLSEVLAQLCTIISFGNPE